MRLFLSALVLFAAATVCSAADLTIVRIWPGYRTDQSFERISEYVGKNENADSKFILRTQPDVRAGYYFLLRAKNTGPAIAEAKIELQVITPFGPEPKTYHFTAAFPAGSHALNLGLTGSDWPGKPKDEAVAWKLRILSSTGEELAKGQSYLWSLPEK
jgi:hypothetical protein